MENIEKKISLEGAKNRLNFDGIRLPMLSGTSFVYDIKFEDSDNSVYAKYLPLVKNNEGETILRYKNLMDDYYWLTNKFIPSCEFYRYCIRNGEDKWVTYKDLSALRGECFINFVNGYDGSIINSVMVLKGEVYTPTITPSRDGYNFIGWYDSAVGGNVFDFSTPIETDVTVYAHYQIKEHVVTFVYYNGSTETSTSVIVPHGGSVDESDIPDPDNYIGHIFEGWIGSYENVVRNVTIVADYTMIRCTILFYVGNEQYAEETIDYGGVPERPTPPYEENYNFVDWQISGTTSYFDFTQPVTEDYNLVAEFALKDYTITFVDWDGTVLAVETNVTYETVLEVDITPYREGYVFKDWTWPDSDTATTEYTMTGFQNDEVIVARYTASLMQANFVLLGTNNVFDTYKTTTYPYNGKVNRPAAPSEEDYDPYVYGIFDGWYEDSGFTEEFNFNIVRTSDITIYGKWKNTFTVEFYNWDGTLITGSGFVNPQTVRYGEDAIVPDSSLILPYGNYQFAGWDKETTNITSDTQIQAVFNSIRIWTVNFVNNITGELLTTVYVANSSPVDPESIPTPPEMYGYTFSNWDKQLEIITGNMTVYTVYDKVSFTVTYVDYYGNTLDTERQEYLDTGVTPQQIQVPDIQIYQEDPNLGYNVLCPYTFSGEFWLVGEETGLTPEMVLITGDTTFVAQYVQNGECQIETFEIIIKSYDNTQQVVIYNKHYGDYITVSEMAQLEQYVSIRPEPVTAYTFYGLVDTNGNEYQKTEDILITRPMTYTMKYEPLSYVFNFIDSITGDAIGLQQRIPLFEKILPLSIPSAPYHENYEWVTNNDNTLWYIDSGCTQVFDFQAYYDDPSPVPEGTVFNLYAKYIRRFNITIHYLIDNDE